MNRPRFVLIGTTSERFRGGIAQFTRTLADSLAETCEVLFISWYQPYPPFLISHQFKENVSSIPVGTARAQFLLGYLNPFSWFRSAKRIRSFSPDIICFSWNHPIHAPIYVLLNRLLRRITKAKIIYICHNILPHENFPAARWLTRLCLGAADRLIVHSKSEEDQAKALLGDIPVTSLFHPITACFSSRQTVARSRRNGVELLFFGYIREYKGLGVLLEALPQVIKRHPDVHLTVAGEAFYTKHAGGGESSCSPEQLVEKHHLENYVTLRLDYIPNEEVGGIFAGADLAVFPYRTATQSGSLTVAYAFGIPVIATAVGGLVEAVVEGRSGYFARPGDSVSLAEAIIKGIERPISRDEVRKVAESLSWERYVSSLLGGGSETSSGSSP